MGSANLELVRSILADWERGDFSSADWAHADIELVSPEGVDWPGSSTGRPAMAARWRETLSAWESLSVTAEEFRELDDARVLVLHRFAARGRASGLEVGENLTKGALLFGVREDKVARLTIYMDRGGAFADLGLAPEAGAGGPG